MRHTLYLNSGFRFKKYDLGKAESEAFLPSFDDIDWREVSIPHDWGIEGDFSADNDPTYRRIVQDGMTKSIQHSGRSGGLPTVGEGIYRKWIDIDSTEAVFLELDGVMWESHVYLNGVRVGGCHFGYLSYEIDLTEHVRPGKNLLVIHAIVYPDCSRWYSGAGVYRNVRVVTKPRSHISYNGVWVRQAYADNRSALFDISVQSVGDPGFTAKITDPLGKETLLTSDSDILSYYIEDPILWDVTSPSLYTALITLKSGDSVSVHFGVRYTEFRRDGFYLNGRYLKMNGVCMHHDLGSIGAAVNRSALLRQIEVLKGMGVNAIRTSHNPPSPELLDLCDESGILVMDEFFDEWKTPKVDNGYSKYFDTHALSDVTEIIKRDRNHPSVILWSIGNEIMEQCQKDGWRIARMLSDKTHEVDPTRPTTAGFNNYPECFDNRLAFYVDVVGLNYKPHFYAKTMEKYQNVLLIASETESCVSTRGTYDLPARINIGTPKNSELTVSDYGLCAPSWAYYAERELAYQKDCPGVMGEFIWTGFDYLGEPTPYYTEWPSRSSYFGVIDLAGLPKNRYWCYRAAWTDIPTLHVFPHWNWEGCEGKTIPVHVYTNYDEVKLFVNGVSYGKKSHKKDGIDESSQLERFRLMWNDVIYTPGTVLAVAYKDGKEAERATVCTAGEPYEIKLTAYRESVTADGESLNYVTASIVDRNGHLCPKASNRLTFSAEGSAFVFATDAGDQRETETFLRPDKKALSGMLVCCLKSNGKKGKTTVTCSGEGLISATASFDCI